MIPYADVGITEHLRQDVLRQIPNITAAFKPPQMARAALAKATEDESIGHPGFTVWRTGANPSDLNTLELRDTGPWVADDLTQKPHMSVHIPEAVFDLTYTVVTWTRDLFDRNTIERIFAHTAINEVIFATLYPKTERERPVHFQFFFRGVQYEEIQNEKNSDVLFYGMTHTFELQAPWIRKLEVPRVESISVAFRQFYKGDFLTDPLLEKLAINVGTLKK